MSAHRIKVMIQNEKKNCSQMQSVSRTQLGPNNQKKKFALFRGGEVALSILVPIPQDDHSKCGNGVFFILAISYCSLAVCQR